MLILKNAIFTVLVPGSVVLWLPWWILSLDPTHLSRQLPGGWHLLGPLLIVVGLAIYIACVSDFMTIGGGTPAPIDPPRRLVMLGLYRYVRNPMYVGVGTVHAGEVVFTTAPLLASYTALVWLIWHLFVLFYEEPKLEQLFGDEYRAYRARVPRWVPRWVPRLTPG